MRSPANDPQLAKNFKTILWLFLAYGVFTVVPLGFLVSPLNVLVPGYVRALKVVAIVCLLVGMVWQIVSSFKLSTALRQTVWDWREVVAVPDKA